MSVCRAPATSNHFVRPRLIFFLYNVMEMILLTIINSLEHGLRVERTLPTSLDITMLLIS